MGAMEDRCAWSKGLIDKHKTHEVKLILCPVKDFRKDIGEFWRKRSMRLQGAVAVSMTKSGIIRRLFFMDFLYFPHMYRHMTGLVWGKITHIGYVDTSKNENNTPSSNGVQPGGNSDDSES